MDIIPFVIGGVVMNFMALFIAYLDVTMLKRGNERVIHIKEPLKYYMFMTLWEIMFLGGGVLIGKYVI